MNNALIRAEKYLGELEIKTLRSGGMLMVSKELLVYGDKKETLSDLMAQCCSVKLFWDEANETQGWLYLGAF